MIVVTLYKMQHISQMSNVKSRNAPPPKIEKQDTDRLPHHNSAMTSALVMASSVIGPGRLC